MAGGINVSDKHTASVFKVKTSGAHPEFLLGGGG
jgi:hypothetical protein